MNILKFKITWCVIVHDVTFQRWKLSWMVSIFFLRKPCGNGEKHNFWKVYIRAQNPTIHIDGFCQHYTATAYFYVSGTRIPLSFKTLLNRLSSPKKWQFIVASSPSPSSLSPTHPKSIRTSLSDASIVGDKSTLWGLTSEWNKPMSSISSPHLTSNVRSLENIRADAWWG